MTRPNIHSLIMAAGASRRFGGKKQLTPIGHKTMVAHQCDLLNEITTDKTHLCVGAFKEEIITHVPKGIIIEEAPNWQLGLGSSISSAVRSILDRYSPDGIMITLCDQVGLSVTDYKSIISAFDHQRIVSSAYDGVLGVPALFPKSFFPDLSNLCGDIGAKKLINQNAHKNIAIPLQNARFDIDTIEDLTLLNHQKNNDLKYY